MCSRAVVQDGGGEPRRGLQGGKGGTGLRQDRGNLVTLSSAEQG